MAVFMDTGRGDIYGGPSKEEVLAEMAEDSDYFDPKDAFEVPGTKSIDVLDENDEPTDELTTLDEEYDESLGTYCVASENW